MEKLFLKISILLSSISFAQVGIGTVSPTETLDINGKIRIRDIEIVNSTSQADSVLVTNNDGVIRRINSKDLLRTSLKTAIKGNFSSNSVVNLNLISNQVKIPFDATEFDLNNEYSIGSNTFTAKQNGIYQIFVQTKADNTIGISTNFGIAIYKNGSLVSRNSYANVDVLGIKVTPPVRSIQNLIQLNTGDTISFFIVSSLATVPILGEKEDTFFTIQQVR